MAAKILSVTIANINNKNSRNKVLPTRSWRTGEKGAGQLDKSTRPHFTSLDDDIIMEMISDLLSGRAVASHLHVVQPSVHGCWLSHYQLKKNVQPANASSMTLHPGIWMADSVIINNKIMQNVA